MCRSQETVWESKLPCLFWRRAEVKNHMPSDLCIYVYGKAEYFLGMTHVITLKKLGFPSLPLLFMLGGVLAAGMKDVNGVLDLPAFSRAE